MSRTNGLALSRTLIITSFYSVSLIILIIPQQCFTFVAPLSTFLPDTQRLHYNCYQRITFNDICDMSAVEM